MKFLPQLLIDRVTLLILRDQKALCNRVSAPLKEYI